MIEQRITAPAGAIFVSNSNMAPTIPYRSVVFLKEPGFHGEGIYSFPYQGRNLGDLRRVSMTGGGLWRVSIDQWDSSDERTREALIGSCPQQVTGLVTPMVEEFAQYLNAQFERAS